MEANDRGGMDRPKTRRELRAMLAAEKVGMVERVVNRLLDSLAKRLKLRGSRGPKLKVKYAAY